MIDFITIDHTITFGAMGVICEMILDGFDSESMLFFDQRGYRRRHTLGAAVSCVLCSLRLKHALAALGPCAHLMSASPITSTVRVENTCHPVGLFCAGTCTTGGGVERLRGCGLEELPGACAVRTGSTRTCPERSAPHIAASG